MDERDEAPSTSNSSSRATHRPEAELAKQDAEIVALRAELQEHENEDV